MGGCHTISLKWQLFQSTKKCSDKCPSSYKVHIGPYLLWDTTVSLKRTLNLNTSEYKVIFIKAHESLRPAAIESTIQCARLSHTTLQPNQPSCRSWPHVALKINQTPCRGLPLISWWGTLVVQQLYLLTQDSHGLWWATSTAKAVSSINPFLNMRYQLPDCFFSRLLRHLQQKWFSKEPRPHPSETALL